MKRMMFIAAAFAALVCCSKSETSQNPPTEPGTEDTPAVVEYAFTEGETVTITAGASLTKVSSALNDKNGVDFKWQADDTIKVMVDDKSSVFKVSKLKDGGANAEFTGKMPDSGNDFDVQYPVTDPDLTEQTYTSGEAIPHDAMQFTAEGCTVDKPFTLEAVNAAIRLNLYGTDQTVGKIVVTNTTSTDDPKPSYTLIADPAITIGTTRSDSTSFFIVVPEGSWNFKADIFSANASSYICSYETTSAKTFTANQILNMSAKEVKKAVLLPGEFSVSAGKKVKFTNGNLWWDGSAFHIESSQTAYPTSWSTDHVSHFFWTNLTDYQSGTASYMPYASSYSYSAQSTSDEFWCGESNKMTVDDQSDLYALTKAEWSYLFDGRTDATNLYKYDVSVTTSSGMEANCVVIAPDGYTGTIASSYSAEEWSTAEASGLVCLPAAGARRAYMEVEPIGYYWSATPSENEYTVFNAYLLYFCGSYFSPYLYDDSREDGRSVRLVSTFSE